MNFNRQIGFNYIFKGVGIFFGLLFVYLLRLITEESIQAEYFKFLVYTSIGSSLISFPSGYISASSNCSSEEVKYLFYLQIKIALISAIFLVIILSLLRIEHALFMAFIIAFQSVNNQLPELFIYGKKKLIYSLTAFTINPALSIVFLLIKPIAIFIVFNAVLCQLIISSALFVYHWNNFSTKKYVIQDPLKIGSIYATDLLNNIKTNLDKIVVINFGSVKIQTAYFILEKIYRLSYTLFNVNSSYYFVKWSKVSQRTAIITDYLRTRTLYNRAVWTFVISMFLFKPLIFEFLNIEREEGNLIVCVLTLSVLIRLLTGYTFVLLKVLNASKIFGLNLLHLVCSYILLWILGSIALKELVVPFFVVLNSILLSFSHWFGLRKNADYFHLSRLNILLLIAAVLLFIMYLC